MRVYILLLVIFCFQSTYAKSVPSDKANPLLLISLDGIRADMFDLFVAENPKSSFTQLINEGVRATYMEPSFPSLTFPNHWTIVTGLYPESHGIVDNRFYDSQTDFKINLLGGIGSLDQYWWNQTDPIWLTAREQGLKTGSSFWPGSETWPRTPDMYLPFNKYLDYRERIDGMIDWFKKFNLDFGTLYFDQPDGVGHHFGPNSDEYKNMFFEMDSHIGYLIEGLKNANLYDKINILLLSDHGMAELNLEIGKIYLDDFINTDKINKTKSGFSKISHIYPNSDDSIGEIVDSINSDVSNVKAYRREDVPAKFHYTNNARIGPIVVIADEGFSLVNSEIYKIPIGNHGYDNSLESMRTIFVARGPDFKVNEQVKPFENVNVYPLMCKLMKIDDKCHNSNGSETVVNQLLKSNSQIKNQFNLNILMSSLFVARFLLM